MSTIGISVNGNVGKGAEKTAKGYKFSLAAYSGKDLNGEKQTAWFTVYASDFVAERIVEDIEKGAYVQVVGTMTRSPGEKGDFLGIFADRVEVLRAPSDRSDLPAVKSPAAKTSRKADAADAGIPF